MKGRKPKANAIRRGGAEGETQVIAKTIESEVVKPDYVASTPQLNELWDTVVGSGVMYKARDVPMLEQLVFALDVATEAARNTRNPDGSIKLMVGKGKPDPETGEYMDHAPNPFIDQAFKAAQQAMKLADQLGCAPLAAARLGYTQAAGKALQISIAEQIDAAVRRGA